MKKFLFLVMAFFMQTLAFGAGENAQKVLDLNFLANDPAIVKADPEQKAQGRVTGELPAGWEDNSAWAAVNVNYQLLVEEGQRYIAMKVGNVERGYALVRHLLPDFGEKSFFKLTLKARGTGGAAEFGVRMAGAPHEYLWSRKEVFDSIFQTHTYFFSLDRNKQPVGFWVEVREPGEVDLAQVTLERVSREQLEADLSRRYPDGGPANILRATRLPLGLQSGWTPSQFPQKAHETEIYPDSEEKGVSGFPALHIKSNEKSHIYGEPFDIPVPTKKYTASLFFKGEGTGKLIVLANRKGIAAKDFTATEQWQRVEVPFDPRLGEKLYALRLETAGDMLVDAWQVNPGDKATAYQSQLPVEVSLACPAAETGEARVQFSDEPALAQYYVSGNPFVEGTKGSPTLHAKIVNLYGEEALIKPIALKNSSVNVGKFNFNLFPKRPLGPMRIETWVEDAKGQRISTFQELVIYRLQRPRYWGKDAPDSSFGTHAYAETFRVKMAKAIGNNWVRLHDTGLEWLGWNFLERKPGEWTFYDDVIGRYRKQHLKIFGSLCTSPVWASALNRPTRGGAYFDKFSQPKDPAQFANYVRTVVARYKGVIDTYETWNEPWNAAWFGRSYDETKSGRAGYKSGENPQAEYAALCKLTNETIKAIDPRVTVVGINTTTTETNTKPYPDTGGADWSKGLKTLDADKDCDVYSYHQYDATFQGYPGDAVEKGFKVAMGPFLDAGVAKPVWFTEGNPVWGIQTSGFYHYTLPYVDSENTLDTGNRYCRFVISLLANGCSKVFLYSMGDFEHFGGIGYVGPHALISEDGYLHPSAAAFSHMAWELEDTKFSKIMPMGGESYVYLFKGKKKTVAVLAPAKSGAKIALPRRNDWTVSDQLGNPPQSDVHTANTLVYIATAQSAAEFEADLAKVWQKK